MDRALNEEQAKPMSQSVGRIIGLKRRLKPRWERAMWTQVHSSCSEQLPGSLACLTSRRWAGEALSLELLGCSLAHSQFAASSLG